MGFRARRLDRWYVPNRWLHRVESYGLLPGTNLSDHAPALLLFNLADGNRLERRLKSDVWRVNLSLLQDQEVGESIKGLWRQQEQNPAKTGIGKLLKAMEDSFS